MFFYISFSNIYSQSNCNYGDDLTIGVLDQFVEQGECICIPFYAFNVEDIGFIQFQISWDPNILLFKQFNDPIVNNMPQGVNIDTLGGTIFYIWFDGTFINPITVSNGDVIYEVCFEAIGDLCSNTALGFFGELIDIGFTNNDFLDLGSCADIGQI